VDESGKFEIKDFSNNVTNYQLTFSVSNGYIRSNGSLNTIWNSTNRVNPPKPGDIFKFSLESEPDKLLYHSSGYFYLGTGRENSDSSSFKIVSGLVGSTSSSMLSGH